MQQSVLPRKMPVAKDSHIVKIAVEMDKMTPQLIEFDQKQPLTSK